MRRTRLTLLAAFTLALLAAPRITGGQGAGKIYRIGVLDDSSPTAASTRTESFRQGMRALGRIEGQNVNIEWRFAEGKEAALSTLATELVGLKPDVLVSPSSAGIAALRNATTEIPLVMAGADPGTRYVTPENLARPGGNITGVISMGREPEGKRMELLREAIPTVSRVAIFRDCIASPCSAGETAMPRPQRWGLTFILIDLRGPDNFDGAFTTAVKEGAGSLSLANTAMFYTHRRRLADLAVKHRLAWVAGDREYAESGCLMSYGADARDQARRAASYVDRILRGAKVADLPIEQPTKYELVINLKTAKALGFTIPPAVLARADEVIQ